MRIVTPKSACLCSCSPHLGAISSKIDVYSLGIVIWELVVGDSPRFGTNWYRPPRYVC